LDVNSLGVNEAQTMILIFLVRIVELVFFTGVAGCAVTIVASWYKIFKEEFTSEPTLSSVHPSK
jgi:hypothetical protein